MTTEDEPSFVADVESRVGRRLTSDERALATSLRIDKSAALIAREIVGAPVADPTKIRPEHQDTAREEGD